MKANYDVIIVGAGPTGSMAGKRIAELGKSVCILEKDRDVGSPVRCGEAVNGQTLKELIDVDSKWVDTEVDEFRIVSPNGVETDAKFESHIGYILNRRVFDYDLSKLASDKGAEVFTKSYVHKLIIENETVVGVKVKTITGDKEIRAKIVIGADGVESRIGRMAGIKTVLPMKNMASCFQFQVGNIDINPKRIDFFMGQNYAPGGYLWIFPKGNKIANIGLGISGNFSKPGLSYEMLKSFLDKHFPNASILSSVCGGVPVSKPLKNSVANGVIIAGDAAHHVNPMTGGGILSGMKAGIIAANVAVDAIERDNYSKKYLSKYEKLIKKEFGDKHDRYYRLKETISKFSDVELNGIADRVEKIPVRERTLMKIFKAAVIHKPSLLLDVVKVFTKL
jgi:digeranylgeranylglycerophospholipid reductase